MSKCVIKKAANNITHPFEERTINIITENLRDNIFTPLSVIKTRLYNLFFVRFLPVSDRLSFVELSYYHHTEYQKGHL